MKQERYLRKLGLILIVGAAFLFLFGLLADVLADYRTKRVVSELDTAVMCSGSTNSFGEISAFDKPEYLLSKDVPMPIIRFEDREYAGILEIPSIALKQAVLNEWNKDFNKTETCRFRGSIYRENLMVVEPAFGRAFKRMKSLRYGDSVIYRDLAGNVFSFEVKEIEVLPRDFVDEDNEEYPLTILIGDGGGKYTIIRVQ